MARVDVVLQGRRIPVTCADGQEERVREVAAYVDQRMAAIREALRGPSDLELLAVTSIAMGDELLSLQEAGKATESQENSGGTEAEAGLDEAALAHILETLAGRIEAVAARLEGA